jgi:uncharacterized protein YcfJ
MGAVVGSVVGAAVGGASTASIVSSASTVTGGSGMRSLPLTADATDDVANHW